MILLIGADDIATTHITQKATLSITENVAFLQVMKVRSVS